MLGSGSEALELSVLLRLLVKLLLCWLSILLLLHLLLSILLLLLLLRSTIGNRLLPISRLVEGIERSLCRGSLLRSDGGGEGIQ